MTRTRPVTSQDEGGDDDAIYAVRSQGLDGKLALLAEQDRSRWDRACIDEGLRVVRWCLRHNQPGPYQLQATINAVHIDATSPAETDWSQIVALYDQLLEITPTPVVALNRAVAIGEVQGPAVALAVVDKLDLDNCYPFHATRADLLRRLGRPREAAAAYTRAAALAPTSAPNRRATKAEWHQPRVKARSRVVLNQNRQNEQRTRGWLRNPTIARLASAFLCASETPTIG